MSSDSLIHSVAGAAGGALAMTATYPLVFISTRAAVERSTQRKTLVEAVRAVIAQEGVAGLYSGLQSSVLGIAITNGVYYLFYERSREVVVKRRRSGIGLSTVESMIIGLIAGSATSIITNPIWVIQTAQTVRTMAPSGNSNLTAASHSTAGASPVRKLGFVDTIRQIYKTGGLVAFWRGLGAALVLVLNPIIQYTVFEQLKNLLVTTRRDTLRARGLKDAVSSLSDRDFFLLGALSKLVATTATYPYIVVKSRLQAGRDHGRYKSAFECLVTTAREEGIGGLYKGVESKLVQSVLTAAILFASQRRIYEITKKATGTATST